MVRTPGSYRGVAKVAPHSDRRADQGGYKITKGSLDDFDFATLTTESKAITKHRMIVIDCHPGMTFL